MRVSGGRISLLMGLVVAAGACGEGEAAEQGPAIQTAEVTRGDLVIRAEATGTVEPVRVVEVKSKASGEILRLHVDIGDQVEPETLLAEIDPRDVQNRYDQNLADLEVAKARSEIARAQLDRSTQLLEAGVITQQEHEGARLENANGQAALVKAQTNFELAELQMNDVSIRAPMSGTIIQKNVEEGVVIQSASQNVSGGTTLFTMADLAEMQVRTLVDETDMGQLRPGMSAAVTVEAFPDRAFEGRVEKIEPQATVEQNVTMFPVIVTLDNRSGLLRPGMNAEVQILVDEAPGVLLVPNSAIVKTDDVGPAALALGLDIEQIDLGPFMGGGSGGRFVARGAGEGGGPGGAPGRGGARAGAPDGAGGNGDQAMDAAPDETAMAGGEVASQVQQLRARPPAEAGALPRGGDAAAGLRTTRPAAVFVMGADSIPQPRLVQIGLNDWDRTEVVRGVDEGEVLVIVGAAQLQAQQQEFLDRMRSRIGGGPFGGGPGGGRRGG